MESTGEEEKGSGGLMKAPDGDLVPVQQGQVGLAQEE